MGLAYGAAEKSDKTLAMCYIWCHTSRRSAERAVFGSAERAVFGSAVRAVFGSAVRAVFLFMGAEAGVLAGEARDD